MSEFYEANPPKGYHIKAVVDGLRETGELVTTNGGFAVSIEYAEETLKPRVDALGFKVLTEYTPVSASTNQ